MIFFQANKLPCKNHKHHCFKISAKYSNSCSKGNRVKKWIILDRRKNKGNKSSEEKFKEASEAYHVLSDDKRKTNYDQFGHAAFEGGGSQGFGNFDFGSSFSDIFEDFFGDDIFGGGRRTGRRSSNRGNDLRYDVSIDLEDAYKGLNKKISYTTYKKCSRCTGQGSEPGSKPIACNYCNGRGKVRSNQGFFTIQQTCPECSGYGETVSNPCRQCSGNGKVQSKESVSVKIPKGVDDGTRIRVSGKGEAGTKGGSSGDLYLFISIDSHSIFKDRMNTCILNYRLLLQMQL